MAKLPEPSVHVLAFGFHHPTNPHRPHGLSLASTNIFLVPYASHPYHRLPISPLLSLFIYRVVHAITLQLGQMTYPYRT